MSAATDAKSRSAPLTVIATGVLDAGRRATDHRRGCAFAVKRIESASIFGAPFGVYLSAERARE